MGNLLDNRSSFLLTFQQPREIVLDIPTDAVTLNYGFYVRGEGTGFGSNFSLKKVSKDTPLTTELPEPLSKPFNLNFQE